jgi:hypothetical protein
MIDRGSIVNNRVCNAAGDPNEHYEAHITLTFWGNPRRQQHCRDEKTGRTLSASQHDHALSHQPKNYLKKFNGGMAERKFVCCKSTCIYAKMEATRTNATGK